MVYAADILSDTEGVLFNAFHSALGDKTDTELLLSPQARDNNGLSNAKAGLMKIAPSCSPKSSFRFCDLVYL